MVGRRSHLIGLMILALASTLCGQQNPQGSPKSLDPKAGGLAFQLQGEYLAEFQVDNQTHKWGAQIIALGDNQFRGVFYPGGLPGQGWDRPSDEPRKAEAAMENGAVTFRVDQFSGVLKDGVMVVTDTQANREIGAFQKVIRKSPTLGAKPPKGAIILFDGEHNDFDKEATAENLLPSGANSRHKFGACTLHVEFLLPFEPGERGQARGNSGCYLQGRYEVQILDSFGLEGKNNECGGIYEIAEPAVNMCYPPLQWQTYDIEFSPASFLGGVKVKDARITVKHNGVLVQDNVAIPRATRAAPLKESAEPGFLHLQDHGHPVRFRNIWMVEK